MVALVRVGLLMAAAAGAVQEVCLLNGKTQVKSSIST